MRFADFHVGQIIEAGPCVPDADEIVAFAKAYDPQWFHTDPEKAAHSRFGGLIASGWHTCGLAMRLIVDHVLRGSESYASPGLQSVKWPNPVRPGDMLHLKAEVLEVRTGSKQPTLGILRWRWLMTNQHGAAVLEVDATSLFDLSVPAPSY